MPSRRRAHVLLGVAAGVGVSVLLAACDSESGGTPQSGPSLHRASDQPSVDDGVFMSRSNGDFDELPDAGVECRPADEAPSVQVVRLTVSRVGDDPRRRRMRESFFYVEAVPGTVGWFELPLAAYPSEEASVPDLTVFGYDAEDGNELSAVGEEATGSVTVLEASCDPEPRLAFTIRATLDSEFGDMPPVTLVGGAEAGR